MTQQASGGREEQPTNEERTQANRIAKMSPEERTTQKLLEDIERNKKTRKGKRKAVPASKKP